MAFPTQTMSQILQKSHKKCSQMSEELSKMKRE